MIWLGMAIVVVVVALVILLARVRNSSTQQRVADVDSLFSTGIVITGAGVVLGTTISPVMYAVMAAHHGVRSAPVAAAPTPSTWPLRAVGARGQRDHRWRKDWIDGWREKGVVT